MTKSNFSLWLFLGSLALQSYYPQMSDVPVSRHSKLLLLLLFALHISKNGERNSGS